MMSVRSIDNPFDDRADCNDHAESNSSASHKPFSGHALSFEKTAFSDGMERKRGYHEEVVPNKGI
jgi:hypothetical protein